jgi:predicted RNase H-like HicB family nuclease
MADTVNISLRLLCQVKKETRQRWVAGCPQLDVYSQGKTEQEAKDRLKQALLLWVESCFERGTLEDALRQVGFRRVASVPLGGQHIVAPAPETEATEGTFPVHLSIPAYQAAALLPA